MSFAEKGAVADIDPAFYVGYLHRLKATGTLKFEDAPIQRAIYLRDGRVLFSSSNAAEDQLGAILVAGGKIEQDQFDLVVSTLQPKQSIAAALAQGGHVSQRDIGDAARRKVEQIVGSCCAQTSGRYEFEDGVLPKGALDLKLTTEKVLVSAFEALEPSGFLIRVLKSPMAVLAPGEAEPEEPELKKVRDALDGVSSLADVGGAVGLPLAATEVRAAVLVVLGAASVVTSQIEEMSLPDTGETLSSLSLGSPEGESNEIQAETIAFAPVAGGGLDRESTLAMPAEGDAPFEVSTDSTLVMGEASSLPPPSDPDASARFRNRATTQDLEAVKRLIEQPPTPAARPGAASIPAQRWEPRLSTAGRTSRERSGPARAIENPVVRTVAALLFVVVVGALGWFAYSVNQPAPTGQATARMPVPSPSPPAATDPTGALLPQPPSAATAPPAAATPGPAVATPDPAAAAPVPVAATPLPAPPASTPAPRATPVRTPGSTPGAEAVRALPPPGAGYEAMKAGRLDEAATAFAVLAGARRSEFSVQVLVACSPETIGKALQNDPSPDLFILSTAINGRACHRLMRGFFKTSAEAAGSVASFPSYYRVEGARPRAVAVQAVLP